MSHSRQPPTPQELGDIAESDLNFVFRLRHLGERVTSDARVWGAFVQEMYDPQVIRRLYIRMFIALVESVITTLKDETLKVKARLSVAEQAILAGTKYELTDQGKAVERPFFAPIQRELFACPLLIELLYLCLSVELCELRSEVKEPMIRFFKEIYPQPAISSFLVKLTRLDGGILNDLPQRAGELYKRLLQAFGRFLEIEVCWGSRKQQMPVWKLLYGNYYRLDLVGKSLKRDKQLIQATLCLEAEAQAVIKGLLAVPGEKDSILPFR